MTRRVQPWTVTHSQHLRRDRWISLRVDGCLTAEGVPVSPYYVLDYPDWVNVVALDKDDYVVLVRQYRHALGCVSLELPCGGMEPTDENPITAGARELLEETGYGKAERMTLIASLSPNTASHSNLSHTVLAENVVEIQPPQYDDIEVLEVERVPYREALQLAFNGAMMQALHVSALVLGLRAAGKIDL
jgi:8-oxo-dGDP phosphatase